MDHVTRVASCLRLGSEHSDVVSCERLDEIELDGGPGGGGIDDLHAALTGLGIALPCVHGPFVPQRFRRMFSSLWDPAFRTVTRRPIDGNH